MTRSPILDRIAAPPERYCSFIDAGAAIFGALGGGLDIGGLFGGLLGAGEAAATGGIAALPAEAAAGGIAALPAEAAAIGAADLGAGALGSEAASTAALAGAGAAEGAAGGIAALPAEAAAPSADLGLGSLAATSSGALDAGAGALPGTTALNAAPTSAIGMSPLAVPGSAIPSTGAAVSPLATLDPGAATAVLDSGVGASGIAMPGEAATAYPEAAAAGEGGGGIIGGLKSAGSTLSSVAPLASLGLVGSTLLNKKSATALPPQAQAASGIGANLGQVGQANLQAGTAVAGNLAASGQQNLTRAANQEITAPQQSQIDQWVQQQTNQLYQMYAKSGRDPNSDSDYLQQLQQIRQQAVSMKQQFIDQETQTGTNQVTTSLNSYMQSGLGATGQATGALQGAAQMQISQDQNFETALSNALRAFGLTAAMSSGKSPNLSVAV